MSAADNYQLNMHNQYNQTYNGPVRPAANSDARGQQAMQVNN